MVSRTLTRNLLATLLVLLLSLCPGPARADAPVVPSDPAEMVAFIDELMAEQMAEYHIPGAALAVVKDGKVATKGYGQADLERQTPVDPEHTLFRIASVTKLFTWTAVMQMVEQGKLDLNADVNGYLEGVQIPATYPQPITLAHLMAHTAGFEDRGIGNLALVAQGLPPLEASLAQDMPARVRAPGEVSAYSNYGTALAGLVVAQTAGTSWEAYVQANILDPLGMAHSSAQQPLPAALAPDLAQGYVYAGDQYRAIPYVLDKYAPAGAMSSTAADMARFMLAHLQNGAYGQARILSEATAQLMHTQSFTHHPQMPGLAHGFHEMRINGRRAIFHDGSLQGYISLMLLVPDENLGLFVVYNSYGGSGATDDLLNDFFDHYYPAPAVPALQPPAGAAQRASAVTGTYQATRRPYTTIEVLTHNVPTARLTAEPNGNLHFLGLTWVELEPLLYRATEGEDVLAFRTDGRGQVTGAFLGTLSADRLRWYELQDVRLVILAACLVLALTGSIGWPLAALLRRRKGLKPAAPLARAARWVAALGGGLAVVQLAALVIILGQTPLVYGLPWSVRALALLSYPFAALALAAIVFAVLAWVRRWWGVFGRLHYSLVAVALAGMAWLMAVYNLL